VVCAHFIVSKVCRSRGGHQVVNADCRVSPFRDGIADAVISIAVIHHLATEERRLLALQDIIRKFAKSPGLMPSIVLYILFF
jgi:alkylated DNA repair protein alkB family protein 8